MSEELRTAALGAELEGYIVSRCVVEFAFTLDFMHDRQVASLRIETPFECNLDGSVFHCDAGRSPEQLGPALRLFQHTVEAAWIADDDALHVVFDGQLSLAVPRDPVFESWTLNGPAGELIVAGPGSRLTVFGPHGKAE